MNIKMKLDEILINVKENTTKAPSSSSSSYEVTITDLSNPINGKFGQFRTFKVNDQTLVVDERKVQGSAFFHPSCKATVVFSEYQKDGKARVSVNNLIIQPQVGCGYFIPR